MNRKHSFKFKFIWLTLVLIGVKYLISRNHLEIFVAGPLISPLISSDIFLLGFILAGILPDYKEAERLPADIITSITSINDEADIEFLRKNPKALQCKLELVALIKLILQWFEKSAHTEAIFKKLTDLNYIFSYFEKDIASSVVSKIKNEKDNIRKCVLRIQEIRAVNFSNLAYSIVEMLSFVIIVVLLFLKGLEWYDGYLYLLVFSLLMVFLIDLVRSMDNPFDYYSGGKQQSAVSLYPFVALKERLEKELVQFKGAPTKPVIVGKVKQKGKGRAK